MTQLLDITKPAKEIIIDKYNAKSGVHIQYHFVELGQLTVLAPGPQKENTKIELLPTVEAPWLNKFHLSYQRMDLVDIFSAPYLFVPSAAGVNLYDVLDEINLAVGLNFTVDDLEDAPIVYDPDPQIPPKVTLKTKPGSVFYIGETDLTFDKTLNAPTASVQSNTVIYALVQNSAGMDRITAHAFDGYPATNYVFLKNVDLIANCKIDKILSCEQNLLVVCGTFSFVASKLPFITPGVTYKTITLNRMGHLVSARVEECPMAFIPTQYIDTDREKGVYYIADVANQININPKRVYRLFENGTLDAQFNYNDLDDEVVKVIPAGDHFYTVSFDNNEYSIKRYTYDGLVDAGWSVVKVKTNSGPFINLDGFAHVDEFGKEVLEMIMSDNEYTVAASPDFIATTVQVYKSIKLDDFFSPFFSIHEDGTVVKASGYMAQFNNRGPFSNNYWRPKLVRNVKGGSAVYGQNTYNYLKYPTVVGMLVGEDKDYVPVVTRMDRAEKVTDLVKVYQVLSGYETYVLVELTNRDDEHVSTGIMSFGPDHTFNGVIMSLVAGDEKVTDLAVMR